MFFENVSAHFNHIVRSDSKQVRVECRMVESAKSEPVGDGADPERVGVRRDVGSRE